MNIVFRPDTAPGASVRQVVANRLPYKCMTWHTNKMAPACLPRPSHGCCRV